MDQFPGEYVEFLSTDSADDEIRSMLYPVEYLNSLNPGSLPHCLKLKVGSPIMLFRNISPKIGVFNSTRLICRPFKAHIIEAEEIATGPNKEATFLIPRIDVFSNEAQTTIHFRRGQFPVRPAFAMTINKVQGQTLDFLGLFLNSPIFSHGQLHVAFLRIKQPSSIKILLDRKTSTIKNYIGSYTDNIVFDEVFK